MKISVVIPCRNEAPYIGECIDAIYANKFENNDVRLFVYVVDGMSDDGTREVVMQLQQKYSDLFLIDNEKKLTPFAFNLGIFQQKADYIQIVGARHILSENYMETCILHFEKNPDVWCVGGKIINEYINNTGEIIARAMGTSFGMGLGNFRTLEKSGYTDTVTSPMYPFRVFEKIGYFDEELIRNQDDDFNFRVTQAGGKIYYDASIFLKYYVRGNGPGLKRQFFQYGYWKVYVNKKHKAVTTLRQLIPPLFVLYCCTLVVSLLLYTHILVKVYWIPFYLYTLLLLLNSFRLSDKAGEFWDFIKTFLILHFSYGFGYLRGIIEFIFLGKKPSERQKRLSR